MLAMQYQITLPADYDMSIIRRRIARGGPLLDHYKGLGFKAFLLREKDQAASPVNQYAPFYIWTDISAAASFLWGGGGLDRVVSDFGRPAVQTWVGGAIRQGPSFTSQPRTAVKSTTLLSPHTDPADAAAEAQDEIRSLSREASLHSAVYAIDPRRWELVTFAMYTHDLGQRSGEGYEVLHLSTPSISALPWPSFL